MDDMQTLNHAKQAAFVMINAKIRGFEPLRTPGCERNAASFADRAYQCLPSFSQEQLPSVSGHPAKGSTRLGLQRATAPFVPLFNLYSTTIYTQDDTRLEETLGLAHRALDVERLDVLPLQSSAKAR